MKFNYLFFVYLFSLSSIFAQDISFIPRQTSITDTMGKEIVFTIDVTNISSIPQTVFLVRSQSNIPANWSSSLCLDFCFPSYIDSVATTPDFGSSPFQPGETREVSLHVYTSSTEPGQGVIQLKAGTFRNPNQTIVVEFTASTFNPSSAEYESIIQDFKLEQNYPNPFSAKGESTSGVNPGTTISWKSPISSHQSIKLFNSLGQEIETITEGFYEAGNHSLLYKPTKDLPSGIYFYQLRIGNYVTTRKMNVEK